MSEERRTTRAGVDSVYVSRCLDLFRGVVNRRAAMNRDIISGVVSDLGDRHLDFLRGIAIPIHAVPSLHEQNRRPERFQGRSEGPGPHVFRDSGWGKPGGRFSDPGEPPRGGVRLASDGRPTGVTSDDHLFPSSLHTIHNPRAGPPPESLSDMYDPGGGNFHHPEDGVRRRPGGGGVVRLSSDWRPAEADGHVASDRVASSDRAVVSDIQWRPAFPCKERHASSVERRALSVERRASSVERRASQALTFRRRIYHFYIGNLLRMTIHPKHT